MIALMFMRTSDTSNSTKNHKPVLPQTPEDIPIKPEANTAPNSIKEGPYIGEICMNFNDLRENRRPEIIIRIFNGTGRTNVFIDYLVI